MVKRSSHYISDAARHSISFEMVFPLTRLNSMGYDNKPDNTWEDYYYAQAFPEESSLQRVVFLSWTSVAKRLWTQKYFQKCYQKCHAVIERKWKIRLLDWKYCKMSENIETAAKKRLKENSLAFLDDTVSRMAPRKSIKGNTNKQIAISSSRMALRKSTKNE